MKKLLLAVSLALAAMTSFAYARDVRTIDGDTVVTNEGERIRFSGIDAPSIIKHGPQAAKCDNEMQVGLKAKQRVQDMLGNGASYRIVYSKVNGHKRLDQYGRTLAHVRVGTVDVGNTLLAEGLAKPWDGKGPHPDWCGSAKHK